jgi:hypothetical protein
LAEMQVQITPQDIMEGEDVDFQEEKEHWNIYKLSDGTILKVRIIVTGVKRLKKFRPDGEPLYIIQSQNVVRALNVPATLKLKPKPSATPTA